MSTWSPTELSFARGRADAEALQEVIDETLAALRGSDDEVLKQLKAAGFELRQIASVDVSVREDAQGANAVVTGIIVAVAGGISKDAAVAFWNRVLWPRIRRRLGSDAVGEEREP